MTEIDRAAPPRLPTPDEEARFWALLERAWERLGPEPARLRRALAERDPADDDDRDGLYAIDNWLDPFLSGLRQLSDGLTASELTELDRVAERKLYDIDRADVQAVTDGSDDGFLYARGHIVAMGREFYEAVRARPELAVVDADCEEFCYFFAELHRERFGDWPQTGSGICRESVSNPDGWPPTDGVRPSGRPPIRDTSPATIRLAGALYRASTTLYGRVPVRRQRQAGRPTKGGGRMCEQRRHRRVTAVPGAPAGSAEVRT